MEWKSPEYSKTQVINAGNVIKSENPNEVELKEAKIIVDNWRASHAFPLHVFYCHFKNKYENFIVAERLKRLNSIKTKLRREPAMNLWTMQDLGGCRVIVSTVADVYNVVNNYELSQVRHIKKREYDYIKEPKHSGYRSYHLVYQYQSDKKETYNRNMLIEIQIRTQLQHLWATAVETMGLLTNQALKSDNGDKNILRFFALISSLFAIKEEMPIVPNTLGNVDDIITELKSIESKMNILNQLSAIRVAVNYLEENPIKKRGYYLLILNYNNKRLKIFFYKPSQISEATKMYDQIESVKAADNIDAVLVSVSSFSTLKAAYPNYFSDIGAFVSIVEEFFNNK